MKPEQGSADDVILKHFKKADPLLYAAALPFRGQIMSRVQPKRTNADLFRSLVSSIVSQQLSLKAANSIHARFKTVVGGTVTPEAILAADFVLLRSAGLSAGKVKSITALATAIQSKELSLLSLKSLTAEEAIPKLTAVYGIGPWTAEMFLIFALGAPDIFSPGDLILDRQMRKLLHLPDAVSKKELSRIAERWAPYRSFASLLFWKLNDQSKR